MIKTKWVLAVSLIVLPLLSFGGGKPSIYDLPVTFNDSAGKPVKLTDLKGKPVVMAMTYSSCQYACPRILQRMKALQKNAKSTGKHAQFVVVTFDPERDTPQRLAKVRKESDETSEWIFLTGSNSSIRQLSMVLGIRYQKNPETGDISHDNKIVVLDAQGVITKELNGLNIDPTDSI